jgi:hypothetical protein
MSNKWAYTGEIFKEEEDLRHSLHLNVKYARKRTEASSHHIYNEVTDVTSLIYNDMLDLWIER